MERKQENEKTEVAAYSVCRLLYFLQIHLCVAGFRRICYNDQKKDDSYNMKIYTKTGDTGETGLYGGTRVSKDARRVEACGTVDELNAWIGFVRSHVQDAEIEASLHRIQNELFDVGADLATLDAHPRAANLRTPRILTTELESEIDRFEAELPSLKNFILPGGSAAGAAIHLARTVARRAERCVVSLAQEESVNPEVLIYLNRLSDLLFVLARVVNHRLGDSEPLWESQTQQT